jgi:hypothetical protein
MMQRIVRPAGAAKNQSKYQSCSLKLSFVVSTSYRGGIDAENPLRPPTPRALRVADFEATLAVSGLVSLTIRTGRYRLRRCWQWLTRTEGASDPLRPADGVSLSR